MLTRRTLIRSVGVLGGLTAVSGCDGGDQKGRGMTERGVSPVSYVAVKAPRSAGSDADGAAAAAAVAAFGVDLYARLATAGDNLVISPWSVAVALAMTREGAAGRTASEMDTVLHGTGLGPGLSRLDQALADRVGQRPNATDELGTVGLETANSLWGQQGFTWQPDFLEALAADFAAGMHTVDYRTDAGGATTRINAWTADRTHDRIKHLIPDRVLDEMTRLVLVNAIWFKAPWFEAFEPSATADRVFHRADGSTVQAPTMANPQSQAGYGQGPGWVGASMPYAGRDLAMAVVVATGDTALSTVEASLADGGLARMLGSFTHDGTVDLQLPRWTARTSVALRKVLGELGMPTAFSDQADFSGMTTDDALQIQDALHQGFIAVDEEGTEAAAATAVVMRTTSGLAGPVRVVHADRPFLYVVYDVATRVPLFLGRVTDPTA